MKVLRLVLAVVLLMATSAFAWDREPSTFLGLKLGKALSSQDQVPQCDPQDLGPDVFGVGQPPKFCRVGVGDDFFALFNVIPELAVLNGSFRLVDGNVEYVDFVVADGKQADILAMLRQKYGKPIVVKSALATNSMGATYIWAGRKVTLEFEEHYLAGGRVRLTTAAWNKAEAAKAASLRKMAGSRL